jgi:hypothetical protein
VQDSRQGAEEEIRQGTALVDAAKRARISHLVYSSVCAAGAKTGIPHFESKGHIEEQVRNSGLRYTILRPVFFMENLLGMREAIDSGTLAMPLSPETRLRMIAVDDISVFLEAFETPPEEIVLDLDTTDVELNGKQEARFFHGYYDEYCYLPLYIFAGEHLLCVRLREAGRDAADGCLAEVKRIVEQIRARWSQVHIILRDSGFCRDEFGRGGW